MVLIRVTMDGDQPRVEVVEDPAGAPVAPFSWSLAIWNVVWFFLLAWAAVYSFSEYTNLLSGARPAWIATAIVVGGVILAVVRLLPAAKNLRGKLVQICVDTLRRGVISGHVAAGLPIIMIVLAIAFLLAGFAAIDIQPSAETFTVALTEGDQPAELFETPTGGPATRKWYFVGTYQARRTVTVSSPGLPARRVVLRPWQKTRVDYSYFFRRPAVLILPRKRLFDIAGNKLLRVTIEGRALPDLKYNGEAVWIGTLGRANPNDPAGPRIRVPQWRVDEWRFRLTKDYSAEILERWTNPVPVSDGPVDVNEGDTITVRVYHTDKSGQAARPLTDEVSFKVQTPVQLEEFPQEVEIDARSQ